MARHRRQPPARNWHPLPPLPARNWHPLILTRNPCRGIKTRNPPRAGRLVFQSLTQKNRRGTRTDATGRHAQRFPSRVAVPPARSAASETPPPLGRPGVATVPGSPARLARSPGKPDLRNVVPEDLKDTGRLLELYDQAVELGLVTASEWDRLRFVAAAEHARIIGTQNPCGLFVRLVRGGLLAFRDARRRDGGERADKAAPVRLRAAGAAGGAGGGLPPGAGALGRRPSGAGGASGGGPRGLPGRRVPAAEAAEAGVDPRALGSGGGGAGAGVATSPLPRLPNVDRLIVRLKQPVPCLRCRPWWSA